MDEQRAREILTPYLKEGRLGGGMTSHFISPDYEEGTIALDGHNFTADELEAMAWWMRNKGAI